MKNDNPQDPKPAGVNSFADGNKFFILGVFDDELKKEIILPLTKKIEQLAPLKEATIDIYINSPGGYCDIMWHIVNLMEIAKSKGIKVRTIVMGEACSAASMTAIAGTAGERYIDPRAEHLPHYGQAWGYPARTPQQMDRGAAYTKRHFARILAHYKQYAKVPKIEEHIKDDLYFIPANLCIKYGLADKLVEKL